MTWTKTAATWALFLLLAGFAYVTTPEKGGSADPGPKTEALLGVYADEVVRFALSRSGRNIVCERSKGRWEVATPTGAFAPHDLVDALVTNLGGSQETAIVSENANDEELADFGFSPPHTTIEVVDGEGATHVIELGIKNPTHTALYARRAGERKIFLAGLNLDYYATLLDRAVFPAEASLPPQSAQAA